MEIAGLSTEDAEAHRRFVLFGVLAAALLYIGGQFLAGPATPLAAAAEVAHAVAEGHAAEHADDHGHAPIVAPHLASVAPFALLLLAIAILPLIHRTAHWWEHNQNKLIVSLGLAAVTLAYYAFGYGHGVADHFSHGTSAVGVPTAVAIVKNAVLVEYIPFITLLFSLYVISGGISLDGSLVGRPRLNTALMCLGGLIASFVGTTGAAMLLIRPLLRANAKRQSIAHTVVFFTFVVCNTGGCLLPIGDPPLFIGYLKGVPFLWTLSLWKEWAFINLSLLAIYFVWDSLAYRKENRAVVEAPPAHPEKLGVSGAINFVWLASVIACVALLDPSKTLPGTNWHPPMYLREVLLLGFAGLSLITTQSAVRHKNSFNYDAIMEVAFLFVGIFICMQAPIQILNVHGASLGIDQPWKYFWATGVLSSFLDNAPTYAVFFATAIAAHSGGPDAVHTSEGIIGAFELAAVSLGAVLMGANTYIGNGPNFMVKAIAEKNNVRMPSFFGYMLYSGGILVPLFIITTFLFFRSH